MVKDIDQKFFKVSGRMEISRLFEIDDEVIIALKGDVVKKEILSNQDNSVSIIYVIKPSEAQIE